MEVFSRIVTWLSDHEAAISAVAAILAIGAILFAGMRMLLRGSTGRAFEKASVHLGRRPTLIGAAGVSRMCDDGLVRIGSIMESRPVVFVFEGFEADEGLRELRREGCPVELRATPLRLLLYLLRNRDRVIPKDELLDRVWSEAAVSEGVLSTALKEIRSALGDDGSQQRVIQTLRGKGYRLTAPVEERPAAPARAHAGTAGVRDFVGRGPVLDRLDAALEDALAGRGRIVLLAGEAGIGKTRTAEEFAAAASSQGVPVHAAWCREGKGAPPYWPWVQILRGLVEGRDAGALESELGSGAARIARIVPEIRERLPDLPDAPAEADPEEARFLLFDAVAGFLTRASERQARILVIDDLHWAGASSLQLLEFLAHEIGAARILLLATYRDIEVDRDHPLAGSLAELARADLCIRIPLEGLEPDQVRELVHRLVGFDPSGELAAEVHRKTDGNPFFVRELVNLLAERQPEGSEADPSSRELEVPVGVREVIRGRLTRLSPACAGALETASVIGQEFAMEILAAASQLGRESLAEALDEALRAGLIGGTPKGGYRFAHALTQEAVYVEQSPHRRAQLHGKVGEALERLHAADPDPHLAELAHHFGAAGDAEKAVAYATRAGHRAMDQMAWEEAAGHFDEALRWLERTAAADPIQRCDLLLDLGEAHYPTGNRERYRQAFLEAGQLAGRCNDAERLDRAAIGFIRHQQQGIPDEQGVHLVEEALQALGPDETPRRAELLAQLAFVLRSGNQLERADALLEEASELAQRLGDLRVLARVAAIRGYLLLNRAHPAELLEACDEISLLAEAAGDASGWSSSAASMWRVHALLSLGNLAEADAAAERLAQVARWYRPAPDELAQYEVMKALLAGRFDEAERLIDEAAALARRTGSPGHFHLVAAQTYMLRREQGRLSELEAGLRAWAEQRPEMPAWRCALADLFAALGRSEEARREFEALAASEFAVLPRTDPQWLVSLVLLAEVCMVLEDERRAEVLYELLRPHARLNVVVGNTAVSWGSTDRLLGSLAGLRRRFEESEAHFEAALEMHARMGTRPWTAHTQYDFARMLRARGEARDRDRALELANGALATARELGMVPLAERAEALQQELQGAIPLQARRRREPR